MTSIASDAHRSARKARPSCTTWLVLLTLSTFRAEGQHITPFTGAWKLNVHNSRFNPGPPFQSFLITFTSDGTRHLDLVSADGHALEAALPWSDGRETVVTGMENTTATSKIEGRTFHDVWKQNGKVIEDVNGAISSDGKTLSTTVDGTGNNGRKFHNELLFEKQ